MQEGSFRCDANVSVRPKGQKTLGTRTEIKNINSFRFVERAIDFEIARQIEIVENGGQIIQETRLYDADLNETRALRTKETAQDYRYFSDPDLLPVLLDEQIIHQVRQTLPELPWEKMARFQQQYELNVYDAGTLTTSRELADYFEATIKYAGAASPKIAANWILGELSAAINKAGIDIQQVPVDAKQLGLLLKRIADNTLSGKLAKSVFEAMWNGEGNADDIIAQQGLQQITDSNAIEKIVDEVIAQHPQQLADYRAGKEKLFGFFVGEVMKRSKGKANPQQVNEMLKSKL